MKIKSVLGNFFTALVAAVALMILATVPGRAVTTLNLTAGHTTPGGDVFAGAIWATTDQQPTGTGVIDPFLRLQNNGTETGLNSDEKQKYLLADTKASIHTHDLLLADAGMTTMGGVDYYAFFLDFNEQDHVNTQGGPLLSLDTFQLFTRPTSITNDSDDSVAEVLSGGGVLRYDLDAGTDRAVLLDYNYVGQGSGAGDMYVYVPAALFAAAGAGDFLYLHTQFGLQPGYGSDSGFEEWASIGERTSVPDGGATIVLLGFGMLSLGFARRLLKL